MGSAKTELRELCRRLRKEERLSYRKIHEITGASKGSLSLWLSDLPLSREEREAAPKRKGIKLKSRGTESKLHSLFPSAALGREQKAQAAETAVLLRLSLLGFKAYSSPFDCDGTDWLADIGGGRIIKIAVRWAGSWNNGLPIISLRKAKGHSGHERYAANDFDVMVAYDLFSDTCFVYLADELAKRRFSCSVDFAHAEAWEKLKGLRA